MPHVFIYIYIYIYDRVCVKCVCVCVCVCVCFTNQAPKGNKVVEQDTAGTMKEAYRRSVMLGVSISRSSLSWNLRHAVDSLSAL